jgi:hypothetical protein
MVRHQSQGLLVFGAGLVVTSGTLWAFGRVGGGGHPVAEVVLLTAANLAVTAGRFLAFRGWVFRRVW